MNKYISQQNFLVNDGLINMKAYMNDNGNFIFCTCMGESVGWDVMLLWVFLEKNKLVNGSQLAKLKKSIPLILLPWNSFGRSSKSKKFQKYLKNYDFCEYVKFGAISWKIDNWPINS